MIEVFVMPQTRLKDFDEFFEHNVNFAIQTLKQSGQVHSMVIGQAKDKTLLALLPFSNQVEKVIMLEEVRALFWEAGVTLYSVMNEAWSAPIKPEQLADYQPGDAEKSTERIECLVIASVSYDNRRLKMFEIQRDSNESITDVVHIHTLEGDDVQGVLMELLPDKH